MQHAAVHSPTLALPCPLSSPIPSLCLQLMHEVAHAVIAGDRNIKVAPSFLIPNAQLGTFGSVTQASEAGRAGLGWCGTALTLAGRGGVAAACGSGLWLPEAAACKHAVSCSRPTYACPLPPAASLCLPADQVDGALPHRPF